MPNSSPIFGMFQLEIDMTLKIIIENTQAAAQKGATYKKFWFGHSGPKRQAVTKMDASERPQFNQSKYGGYCRN